MVDFKKMRLRALKEANVLGSDELSLFSWFLKETDKQVARMRRNELKALDEKHATGDPAPNDSGLIAIEYFSRRLQYSHVLQLAMLLEAVLKREVARMIQGIGSENAPFSPQDLKSDPWTANRKVLEAYGQFKIPEKVWAPIKDLINVRRVLVHENGYTGSFSKDEIAALRKISGIEIVGNQVLIKVEYVEAALAGIKALHSSVAEGVNRAIDRAIKPTLVPSSPLQSKPKRRRKS